MDNLVHQASEENKDHKVNRAPTETQDHLDLVENQGNRDPKVREENQVKEVKTDRMDS